MRRAVITGMGLVTPLACGVEQTWTRLLAGESGAGPITDFDVSDLPCRIACQVPRGEQGDAFNPDDWVSRREQRHMDTFLIYALAAADQAVRDAGFEAVTEEQQARAGVLVGSGIGGLIGVGATAVRLHEGGFKKVSPFFIPGSLINLASGYISIRHNLKGPNHAVATACATGAHAIGDAASLIRRGDADVMLAGGVEAAISRLGIAGFAACRALSTHFNDAPTRASRPYDRERDGFVMGEGAGVVVLEELERARARGAPIYAEVAGYGMSGDAFHVTAPDKEGRGAIRAMEQALAHAGQDVTGVDYINAHGTSTPVGDEIELGAVQHLFGNASSDVSMSSTKSSIGHLLGASGAVEAVFSTLAIRDNVAPPTINLDNPSVTTEIDLVPNQARHRCINAVLTNSFGFGGTNACLILKRVE